MPRRLMLLLLLAPSCARADVIFDNFAPGNTYLGNAGWTLINGGPLQAHVEDAAIFTVTGGDFVLTSIDLAVGHLFGPNVLDVFIHADAGGLPGAVLEHTTLVDQMPTMSTNPGICPPPVHATLSGTTLLTAGASYWIHVSTDTSTDSWAAWNENIIGDIGLRADRWDGGPWTPHTGHPRGTFRVTGTQVPVPGAPVIVALAGIITLRRRR